MMLCSLRLLAASLVTVASVPEINVYDPDHPYEPFDNVAKAVTHWITDASSLDRKEDGWQARFCDCMENGAISSWYQYASSMYLIDTCNMDKGLILRTGHLQLVPVRLVHVLDRHM